MNCQQAQGAILAAENPEAIGDSLELRQHLDRCPHCRALAQKVQHLEEATRQLPLPPSSLSARDAFLAGIRGGLPAARPAVAVRGRAFRSRLPWAVAAAAILVVGVFVWVSDHRLPFRRHGRSGGTDVRGQDHRRRHVPGPVRVQMQQELVELAGNVRDLPDRRGG